MLDNIKRRLLIVNILVFTAVLSAFSVVVYGYFAESIDFQIRDDLSSLVNSAMSSIDADDEGGVPDALAESQFVSNKGPVSSELQWFDAEGQLVTQRGTFPMQVAFKSTPEVSEAQDPHALVLTRPVYAKGKLIGYMRGLAPLYKRDQVMSGLFLGMACGIICGAVLSAFGIHVLLTQSMQPITAVMERLKQFTADASHELINPVTAIKSNASVALKHSDGMRESDKDKMIAIKSAAEQMTSLIDALLQMARLDEPGLAPAQEVTVVNVGELCEKIAGECQRGKHSVELGLSLAPGLQVRGTNTEMQLLYGNIIRNAFDYSAEDGRVDVQGNADDAGVVVRISDTGVGIAAEDREHVFDRFWRAERARTRREGGSGLGLSIAKAIADKYHGSISVTSEVGKGSTFEIRLPKA